MDAGVWNERLAEELAFHDRQAQQRAATFANEPDRLVFADADYLDHETWIRPAWGMLGPLAGRTALDYGCGHGMAAVVMARSGAEVCGFDLSPDYLTEARRRAVANGVAVRFVQAAGEDLPFADRSFDVVWGCAILHHLDIPTAARELRRILKPGGRAVFCEPWGENPLLQFARQWLPYPGKARTAGERPLLRWQVAQLRAVFPQTRLHGYQLLGMIRRVINWSPCLQWLDRLDVQLLRAVPSLEHWCRYVVVEIGG